MIKLLQGILLAVAALLPAVVLMIYIYKKDKIEKEPKGLLAGLFGLGCLSVIPAIILELLAEQLLYLTGIEEGSVLYRFLDYFFGVALIEEGCKLFFTYIMTHNNKHFNCVFDGVVYSVFVSLGFAAAENLAYVFEQGFGTAMLRMVTSIPGHCFFGVIMGYFYSRWFLNRKAAGLERYLAENRVIPSGSRSFRTAPWMLLALAAPTAVHGFYDFTLSLDSIIFVLVFFVFLAQLYVLCFAGIHRMSKQDVPISYAYMDMVLKRYPQAVGYVSTLGEFAPYFFRYYTPPVPQPAQARQGDPPQNQNPYL